MKNTEFSDLKPRVVLGVGAHPDDLTVIAGGAFAKWAKDGAEVYFLVLTDGSKGSKDRSMTTEKLIKTRQEEEKTAAKTLGAKDVFFLDYEDCALVCDQNLKKDIVKVIREVKPDVIVSFDPTVSYVADKGIVNHSDHRAAGQATLDAVFPLARDHLSFPDLLKEGYEPHNVSTVLLVNFGQQNFFVDISGTIDKKMQALAAYPSQFEDMENLRSNLRSYATDMGKLSGCDFAESFVRINIR